MRPATVVTLSPSPKEAACIHHPPNCHCRGQPRWKHSNDLQRLLLQQLQVTDLTYAVGTGTGLCNLQPATCWDSSFSVASYHPPKLTDEPQSPSIRSSTMEGAPDPIDRHFTWPSLQPCLQTAVGRVSWEPSSDPSASILVLLLPRPSKQGASVSIPTAQRRRCRSPGSLAVAP